MASLPLSRLPWRADLVAGASVAGLLLPEAIAYAGLAGMPPAAGLVGLFAGLLGYGLAGRSRFAVVAATSSSAAVVGAATFALGGDDIVRRAALASALVLLTGLVFVAAAAARLGSVASFISRPVLRGFTFGLALAIVLRQLVVMSGVSPPANATLLLAWQWLAAAPQWQPRSLLFGVGALVLLLLLGRWRRMPAALVVLAAGIGVGQWAGPADAAVARVGPIDWRWALPAPPALAGADWLRLGELAAAIALLLFAESYGAIRASAMRHGDAVAPNRDLAALGLANLLAGLFHGTPVGAGYSATVANEAAGAASRAAGWVAAAIVGALVFTVLPLVALTPQPVLAAVVVGALRPALSPRVFARYFRWRRDRVVVAAAALAVLVLGIVDGLLIGIAASLAMMLRDLAQPRLSELARLPGTHDFLSLAAHPDGERLPGLLILRPEAPLFFANVEAMLAETLRRVEGARPRALVLSLEETPDLDGSALEALAEFAALLRARAVALVFARVKPPAAALLAAELGGSPHCVVDEGSVDDAVARAAGLIR